MKNLGVKQKPYDDCPTPSKAEKKATVRYPSIRIEGEDRIKALGLDKATKGTKATVTFEVEVTGIRIGSMYDYDDDDNKPEVALKLLSGEGVVAAKSKHKVVSVLNL